MKKHAHQTPKKGKDVEKGKAVELKDIDSGVEMCVCGHPRSSHRKECMVIGCDCAFYDDNGQYDSDDFWYKAYAN